MAKVIKTSFQFVVYIFALIGFILVGGYFAVRWDLTKATGAIDTNSASYQKLRDDIRKIETEPASLSFKDQEKEKQQTLCKIKVIGRYAPTNAKSILDKYTETYSRALAEKMIFAIEVRLNGDPKYSSGIANCQKESIYQNITIPSLEKELSAHENTASLFPWMNNEEWNTIEKAITKDKVAIDQAAAESGFPARMIVATCIVEQLRLFHTDRELYEKFFKPLEILGNANKMAWGVMSIKEATAINIENNLKNSTSDYYLGTKYENTLNFTTEDPAKERYDRLTTQGDYHYSYLYGALYMKQFSTQWKKAGHDISDRPEILATLFNLGFAHSQPKPNPEVGGSLIQIKDAKYTFGSLAYEFYYSGQLEEAFSLSENSTDSAQSSDQI